MGCFFGKMNGNLVSLARLSDQRSLVLAHRMPASNIGVRGTDGFLCAAPFLQFVTTVNVVTTK